jgi:uncharacterized protein (UPF0332 family)
LDDAEMFFKEAFNQLNEAKFQLEHERFNMAINRSYYTVFYAARALLAKKGFFPKKHIGTLHKFSLEYVKNDNFDINIYSIFSNLMEDRNDADYDILINFDEEEAEEAVTNAELFLDECSRFI